MIVYSGLLTRIAKETTVFNVARNRESLVNVGNAQKIQRSTTVSLLSGTPLSRIPLQERNLSAIFLMNAFAIRWMLLVL